MRSKNMLVIFVHLIVYFSIDLKKKSCVQELLFTFKLVLITILGQLHIDTSNNFKVERGQNS